MSGPGAQAGVWAPNPAQRVDWSNQAWSNDPAGDCNSALIAHLLAMLAGILGVGIFYALTKERSQFVRHHATEALNFTITLMIVTFVVPLGLFMLIGGELLRVLLDLPCGRCGVAGGPDPPDHGHDGGRQG